MANGSNNLFSSGKFYDDYNLDLENPGNTLPGKRLGRNIYGFAGAPTLPKPPRYTLRWQIVGQNNVVRTGASLFSREYYLFQAGGLDDTNTASNQIWVYHTHHRERAGDWHGTEPFVGKNTTYYFKYFGDLPIAVSNATICFFKDKLYLIGGIDANGNELNTVYSTKMPRKKVTSVDTFSLLLEIIYEGDQLNWTQEIDFPFSLSNAKYAIVNDNLYILGGQTNDKYFYNIYSPTIIGNQITQWSVTGGMPNNLTEISLTVDENQYAIYLVGKDINDNVYCPVYQLQFSPSQINCQNVVFIGNTPRQLNFFNLSKVYESFYLLGEYIYSSNEPVPNKNQIYFMREFGDPLVQWEFYDNLPNNFTFNDLIIMNGTFYLLATEKDTGLNVIIEIRLITYLTGNKIYDY